jgi:hypothetical protein
MFMFIYYYNIKAAYVNYLDDLYFETGMWHNLVLQPYVCPKKYVYIQIRVFDILHPLAVM